MTKESFREWVEAQAEAWATHVNVVGGAENHSVIACDFTKGATAAYNLLSQEIKDKDEEIERLNRRLSQTEDVMNKEWLEGEIK